MKARFFFSWLAAAALGIFGCDTLNAKELADDIATIQAVGPEGAGNAAAATAFESLSAADTAAIVPLLRAIEAGNPLARNWLRSAIEVIVERELKAGKSLPMTELRAFALDRTQAPEARRLAFDLMAAIDAAAAGTLVPGFIDDPATELRRDAVAQLITKGRTLAEGPDPSKAIAIYRMALDAARDVDQIKTIATALTKKLGQQVDLPRHFGFLTRWHVIGPFDNSGRRGFAAAYPPEEKVDLAATHQGKEGAELTWQQVNSTNPYGTVDLNGPLGKQKEVTGYAYTEFLADKARPAELRLGCKNAWKVWFNGELIFERDEYHRGQRIDQYKMPVQLKKGSNSILVKLCQCERTEKWTVEWEFQLRVCDATGTAILAADRPDTDAKSGT